MADGKGAGVDPAGLRNIIGNQINPATSEDVAGLSSVLSGSTGITIPASDSVYTTFPTSETELYTFKLNGVTTASLLVTYSDSTKATFISAEKV